MGFFNLYTSMAMTSSTKSLTLGITVMPEWFQAEGIEPVLDRLQAAGATALATSPYLLEVSPDGQGAREPPPDGGAGRVRPLDRPLWRRHEMWVRTAPAWVHQTDRYRGLRYQPSPPGALTLAAPRLLDDVIEAANRRGMAVYMQVMAASPPGYRVQFSAALDDDACRGPNGALHTQRVDKNASLASLEIQAYGATLLCELADRYPGLHGLRVDWPEYPPYDLHSALFDFSDHGLRALQDQGVDGPDFALEVTRQLGHWQAAARAGTAQGAQAAGNVGQARQRLRDAGWDDFFTLNGAGAPLWASKRQSAGQLLRGFRQALDSSANPNMALEPQVFPFPMSHWSGFDWRSVATTSAAVGVKIYTMHWPMIARYWARDLCGPSASEARLDMLTEALADWMGFLDEPLRPGQRLEYPAPHMSHPVGAQAQVNKIVEAQRHAGTVPVIAFAHTYGPVDDVMQRLDLAIDAALAPAGSARVWLNRYGYLSDVKLALIGQRVRPLQHGATWIGRPVRPT